MTKIKVVLLAGGVGGAKLAEGLEALNNVELSIIGNIADDEIFHGLTVSPDIDTLTYSLSNMINRSQGWGVVKDDYKALNLLSKLGNETWMLLGDTDLGLHIYRTNRLNLGDKPSVIASDIAKALDIEARIILPTDNSVKTKVRTQKGWISFQEYFVKGKCKQNVLDLEYCGAEKAKPNGEALDALNEAEIIVFAPSNPLLSIAPILSIPRIKSVIGKAKATKIAVSPLINGDTVKGPAAKIMKSMNMRVDSFGVAKFYKELLDIIMIDKQDKHLEDEIRSIGLDVETENILMTNQKEKEFLSQRVVEIGINMRR